MLATVVSFALLRQVLLLKIIHMQTSVNGYPLGRTFTSLLNIVYDMFYDMFYDMVYDTSRVTIENIPNVTSDFEILSVVMKIKSKFVLLVLVYKPPLFNQNTFIYQLQMQLDNLPTSKYGTNNLGDFNIDQLLVENLAAFEPIISRFHFQQQSRYSIHINGGILDLVLDDEKTDSVNWMPSPYSDHFVIY